LALFGLALLIAAVALGFKNWRAGSAAVVGLLLGVVIAASHGPLAGPSRDLVDGIRSAAGGVAEHVIGG
jgi:hypothetical protein